MAMSLNEVIYFTHELDMLETHLEEHQHFVQKFFIKESPVFWTGVPKPLLFTENQERFKRFNAEPMVIPPEEFNLDIPSKIPERELSIWYDVRRQNRNKSRLYKWDEICRRCDYVLSTDADEVIDSKRAHLLLDLLPSKQWEHIAIQLQQVQFWVNVAGGRKLGLYRVFRSDVPHRPQVKGHSRTATPLIGWHFCNNFLTGEDFRKKAIGITTHLGYAGVDAVPPAEELWKRMNSNMHPFRDRQLDPKAMLGRESLPKFIRENPEKFRWVTGGENGKDQRSP
jgi:hypothetical protein